RANLLPQRRGHEEPTIVLRRAPAAPAIIEEIPEPPIDPIKPIEGTAPLGELLVQERSITPEQLSKILTQQGESGKRIGELLLQTGLIDERTLAGVLSRQLDLRLVDLRLETPDTEAVALLPEVVARHSRAIPLRITDDGGVEVVVADPSDEVQRDLLRAIGRPLTLVIAPNADIQRAINRAYRALASVQQHVAAFQAAERLRPGAVVLDTDKVRDDAPVVKVVDLLIMQALRDRASDIHIEPQDHSVRVRYRIDGALHEIMPLPRDMGPALASRIKIMAGMNIVERRRAQDGQISSSVEDRDLDIRVASVPTIYGEKIVMRLLDKSRTLYRVDDLGMPPKTHTVFSELVRSPFGMVICAGPTGSGKTTTLYATLAEINEVERNIMTIEDPVEYTLPTVNQIQINEQAGVTFAGGLRSILRQDPDVILVGEIRDAETARIAVQSALTGHFVLSSLHATDAASALHRFLDMGIEAFLIAASVRAIVGQRLVRRVCRECAVPYDPTVEELAFYLDSDGSDEAQFMQGTGCNFCAQTGYHGRVGVYELLKIDEHVKELIVAKASHDEIRAVAVRNGMRTMRQEALDLVAEGTTTVLEVMRTIHVL
ncbi:MAG TPA: GspE/PulE family protein, partial [Acidimicrobiales bacterium]|nr:GspE/PulE family protein [Acidimicrobiales bacterium]